MVKTDIIIQPKDLSWLELISPCPRPIPADGPNFSGQENHRAHWIEPTRAIYDHELVLFSRGAFTVDVEGQPYSCGKDSFLIVPPGALHTTWESGGTTGHRYWIHFDWIHCGPWTKTPMITYMPSKVQQKWLRPAPAFVPQRLLHGNIRAPQRAYELAERIIALQNRQSSHERLICRGLLLELLVELLDAPQENSSTVREQRSVAQKVRDTLEFAVDQNDPRSVEQLLESTGYSYAHQCRLFRRQYGLAPLRYMHALRISRAKQLLRDTDWKIAQVAYSVGYRDPLYFSKLFREIVGMPPSAFARNSAG